LNRVRRERDQARSSRALEQLAAACRDERTNTMPAILEAAAAYCTLGEICGVMRTVFGEHRETVVV
jgi:methylmalonyl-CoA mutase, N-terminal domain